MSIDDILGQLKQDGLAYPNRYSVLIQNPNINTERLVLSCENASLPGRSYRSFEHLVYGPKRVLPYAEQFTNELSLIFRCGKDMYERTIFERWQNTIRTDQYAFNYAKEYSSTIEIYTHSREKNSPKTYGVRFFECYPEAIEEVPLSYDSKDEYMKIAVKISYRNWKQISIDELTGFLGTQSSGEPRFGNDTSPEAAQSSLGLGQTFSGGSTQNWYPQTQPNQFKFLP